MTVEARMIWPVHHDRSNVEIGMEVRRFTFAERPELAAALQEQESGAFPEFLLQDRIWNELFPQVLESFPEQQFVLVDSEDELLGGGNAVPFHWDGTVSGLPDGTHDAMARGLEERRRGTLPNTVCGIQAITTERARRTGLSENMLAAGRRRARDGGFEHWLTPLRLLLKERYPLTPLVEYVEWTRPDGAPFDPWLRVWRRAGAKPLGIAESGLVIEGTVAEWERWTGLEMPSTGRYVIEGGQAPLEVDRGADRGRYVEAHLWLEAPIDE